MPVDPNKILNMTDEDLIRWTLSGDAGSDTHLLGQTVLNMRVATRTLEANREMVKQTQQWLEANLQLDSTTKELADHTRSLVRATRGLVLATWGVVLITLFTQAALIYLAVHQR
ncbi:MAG TPA: hypothetical protein VJN21_11755 [Candidatus Acidoferrales bacterium]|nr:hypothetical protein [Candidatus Acidoferrales bacterium]